MGSAETTGTQVGRAIPDARQGSPGVAARALSIRSGGGDRIHREDDGERWVRCQGERVTRPLAGKKRNGRGEIVRGRQRGRGRGLEGQVKVGVVSGACADGVQRQIYQGGGDLSGGGPAPERGRQLPRHRSCGGGVEDGNGDFNFPLHHLHHLPRIPSLFLVRSRYGDRIPRGQNTPEGNDHEGGVTPHNFPGPVQGV